MKNFLLLCVVLVGCGKETTFAGTCRAGDTVWLPVDDAAVSMLCKDPQRIVWPKLPLVIHLADDVKEYRNSAQQACDLWNNRLGKTFLVLGDAGDVEVTTGSIRGSVLGTTSFSYAGGHLSAHVSLMGPSDVTTVYWILAHEFGHVLGLAHDRVETSVMSSAPELRDGLLGDKETLPMFLITSSDRDALQAAYP